MSATAKHWNRDGAGAAGRVLAVNRRAARANLGTNGSVTLTIDAGLQFFTLSREAVAAYEEARRALPETTLATLLYPFAPMVGKVSGLAWLDAVIEEFKGVCAEEDRRPDVPRYRAIGKELRGA